MTFPMVEIFCPECKESMTLVNKPNIVDCNPPVDGFDKQIDYHYICNSNERHFNKWHDSEGKIVNKDKNNPNLSKIGKNGWCDISTNREIILMRFLIPKLDLDIPYSTSTSTAGYSSYPSNNIGFPIKIPGVNTDLGHSILIEKENQTEILIEEMKKKAGLIRNKYPNENDFINKFTEAGQKVAKEKKLSDEEIYELMKDSVELINPINLCLPKEEYFKQINEKYLKFMNSCIDIILSENV